MPPEQGDITLLLKQWKAGSETAFERLVPLVYPRLRELAASYVRRETTPGLMQATALVHELYLRLLAQKKADWNDRAHFYTFAAKIMRMILIDNARSSHAQRRGGGLHQVPLNDDIAWVALDSTELLDLDLALAALERLDPGKVQLIELRYFLGCTAEETAEIAGLSKATVDRELRFARGWLYRHMGGEAVAGDPDA